MFLSDPGRDDPVERGLRYLLRPSGGRPVGHRRLVSSGFGADIPNFDDAMATHLDQTSVMVL
jgi:hypothetical protein